VHIFFRVTLVCLKFRNIRGANEIGGWVLPDYKTEANKNDKAKNLLNELAEGVMMKVMNQLDFQPLCKFHKIHHTGGTDA